MVDNDVDHQSHAAIVEGSTERHEVGSSTKMWVESIDILLPIPVICLTISCHVVDLLGDWRDPYPDNISFSSTIVTRRGRSVDLDLVSPSTNSR